MFLRTKETEPVKAKDSAKFERAKLEFGFCGRRFVYGSFNCDVKEIARRNENTRTEFVGNKTFAGWLRFGKRDIAF